MKNLYFWIWGKIYFFKIWWLWKTSRRKILKKLFLTKNGCPLFPLSLKLADCQHLQATWEEPFAPYRSVVSQLEKFKEESLELTEFLENKNLENEVRSPEIAQKVAFEATDCLILAISVINSLEFDVEMLFLTKMKKNFKKYPPHKLRNLIVNHNLEVVDALYYLKNQWKKERL